MDFAAADVLLLAVTAVLGTFLIVVPVLPGALVVPIAAVVAGAAWGWDDFATWFWVAQAVLVLLGIAADQVIQVLGVRRVGGSRAAMVGGAVGVVAAPLVLAVVLGPFALFLGPPVGAVVGTLAGEDWSRRHRPADALRDAGSWRRELSVAALVAYAVGTAIKLVLFVVQLVLLAIVIT